MRGRLDSLEISLPLPVGHGFIIPFLLGLVKVAVMLRLLFSEGALHETALLEEVGRVAQRPRDAGEVLRGVDVPLEDRRRRDFVLDSIRAGSQGGGEGEIGVAVGAGDPALDPERVSLPYHPK